MMANQTAAAAMLGQPGRTIGALDAVSAIAADCQRSITAAIEKQHRLFVFFKIYFKSVH